MSPVPIPPEQARERELLSESVRRRIQVAILDGTLVAGERLHDDELIVWLGVSRTPIRSALERLTELGLVEMQPNRFTRVAVPTMQGLREALEVFAALTVSAAEGCVARLGDSDVEEFRGLVEPVEAIGRRRGGEAWERDELDAADRVLTFFLRRSDNPLLVAVAHEVRMRLAFAFVNVRVPIHGPVVTAFSVEILVGVVRRDAAAVARTIAAYLGEEVLTGQWRESADAESDGASSNGVDSGGVGAGG